MLFRLFVELDKEEFDNICCKDRKDMQIWDAVQLMIPTPCYNNLQKVVVDSDNCFSFLH